MENRNDCTDRKRWNEPCEDDFRTRCAYTAHQRIGNVHWFDLKIPRFICFRIRQYHTATQLWWARNQFVMYTAIVVFYIIRAVNSVYNWHLIKETSAFKKIAGAKLKKRKNYLICEMVWFWFEREKKAFVCWMLRSKYQFHTNLHQLIDLVFFVCNHFTLSLPLYLHLSHWFFLFVFFSVCLRSHLPICCRF